MERQPYESDVTDEQWALLAPLLEPESKKKSGRPRTANRREIVNAIFYVLKTGGQWRAPSGQSCPMICRVGARFMFTTGVGAWGGQW